MSNRDKTILGLIIFCGLVTAFAGLYIGADSFFGLSKWTVVIPVLLPAAIGFGLKAIEHAKYLAEMRSIKS